LRTKNAFKAGAENVTSIKSRFSDVIANNRLTVQLAFITAENINELIAVEGHWDRGQEPVLA
jgi:hypothetical protein